MGARTPAAAGQSRLASVRPSGDSRAPLLLKYMHGDLTPSGAAFCTPPAREEVSNPMQYCAPGSNWLAVPRTGRAGGRYRSCYVTEQRHNYTYGTFRLLHSAACTHSPPPPRAYRLHEQAAVTLSTKLATFLLLHTLTLSHSERTAAQRLKIVVRHRDE